MASSQSAAARATFHLPLEIAIEILSRLPVKSLLRFQSVCKNWYDLIKTPHFIAKHLQTQVTLNPTPLLVPALKFATEDHEISLICHDGFDNRHINLDILFPNRRNDPCTSGFAGASRKNSFTIAGICNGLVCIHLSSVEDRLVLCNPSTRKFQEIPGPKWNWLGESAYVSRIIYGFGFHPIANDYKLIRIVNYYPSTREYNIRADLYLMSTNTWTEIDVNKLSLFFGEKNESGEYDSIVRIVRSSPPAVLNGVFYWQAWFVPSDQVVVMSFDMGTEMFRIIKTPECLDLLWYGTNWQFVEFNDKLALVVYSDERSFDVWVLNEIDNSWTLQVKVGSIPRITSEVGNGEYSKIRVVGSLKYGELLVIGHNVFGKLKLFSYDIKTRKTMDLYLGEDLRGYYVYLYTGTLLPVMQANKIVLNK